MPETNEDIVKAARRLANAFRPDMAAADQLFNSIVALCGRAQAASLYDGDHEQRLVYRLMFNPRDRAVHVSIGVSKAGQTLVWLPNVMHPIVMVPGDPPVEIDVRQVGMGSGDVAMLFEVLR